MGPDFAAGAKVLTPVDLHDVRAAASAAAGVEQPSGWAGIPPQRVQPDDPRRAVFSQYHGHGARAAAYMVRKGPWKLLYNVAAAHQLFDLSADPDELVNLHDRRPEKAAELERELRLVCDPEQEDRRAHEFERRQAEAVRRLYPDAKGGE